MNVKISKAQKAEEDKWRAESDLRTLVDAEKIKMDKSRLKAAMAVRREHMKALKDLEE